MRSIFLCTAPHNVPQVYANETVENLQKLADLDKKIYTVEDILAEPEKFRDVQYIFSTWEMPQMSETEIRTCFPNLQCVFYAAGTVQYFARPFLACGVKVFSAWAANAVPVAEYTVAQILLAGKGFFASSRLMSVGKTEEAYRERDRFSGNYGGKVGIIGAGMIGKLVIRMLKAYQLEVLVFDPFLADETAAELGVQKCSLAEIFSTCQVVSNHLANNEQTKGILNGALFSQMPPYSTFINTGRGAQVVEKDLANILSERPDMTALLDVTYPEPPEPDCPFFKLENCILSPHTAGSTGDEVHRMAAYMEEEYTLYTQGKPCRYEITEDMLTTMA